MKSITRILCAATVAGSGLFLGASGANAESVLFAAEGADRGDSFFTLDPATAGGTLVGATGAAITGLAIHPITGTLYGSTGSIALGGQTIGTKSLVTIDPTTGAATEIGAFNTLNGKTLADLSFDPLTGILYGWEAGGAGDLYTVDITTGMAALVGESTLSAQQGNGLAFDAAGNLFLASDTDAGVLRSVNKLTGLTTDIVTMNGAGSSLGALAFDGPTLYGVTRSDGELVTIDPVTGNITVIGVAGSPFSPQNAVDGIVFQPMVMTPDPTIIPLPAAAWMGLSLLGSLGVVRTARCKLGWSE